ncbi:MAG: ATP-binding domain-containing protein [Alcanivoracaceae bacterium]
MARITPADWQQLDCLHDEEKATLGWLEEALPDDLELFAGLGWAATHNGGGAYFGEIDIAVLARSGQLLLIEQKNGGLSVEKNDLIKRYNQQPKSVLAQTRRTIDAVKRQWSQQQHGTALPVDYLIYLPDYRVHDISAVSVQAERVVDRTRAGQLPDIIQHLLDAPDNPDLHQQVLDFLHNTAAIVQDPDVASLRIEQRYQQEGQALIAVLRRLTLTPWRVCIRGRAGSGKTLIGQSLFRDARSRGEQVLYLCFNRPLADGVARTLRSLGSVMTVDRLTELLPLPRGEFNPALGRDAFDQRRAEFIGRPVSVERQYDMIIVDEGQDFSASQTALVEHLLKPTGRLLWLEDANQALFQQQSHCPATTAQLTLLENYRSSREIVLATNQLLQLDPPDIPASAVSGEMPSFDQATTEELEEKVAQAVQRLLDKGYPLADITVLSYHGYGSSTLLQQSQIGRWRTRRFSGRYDSNGNQLYTEGELRVDSLHRFKGLQSPAVVLAEIDFSALEDDARRRLYVGMTRARLALTLIFTPSALQALSQAL